MSRHPIDSRRVTDAPNYVHYFTRDEAEAELREGGFRLVEFHPQGSGGDDSGFAVGRAEDGVPA